MPATDTDVFTEAPPLPDADEELVSLYAQSGRTLDDLPYTPHFEWIFENLQNAGDDRTRQEIFHRLHNLRKAGRLPRLGRTTEPPVTLDKGTQTVLAHMVEQEIGRLSKRDQLPYTPAFDRIVEKFNAQSYLELSPHDIWRLVARIAK